MKLVVILFLFGCVITTVHSKPLNDDDSSEEEFEMEVFFRCATRAVELKNDEIVEFTDYVNKVNITFENVLSKLGTDDFDINDYKNMCSEFMNKLNKLLASLRAELETCSGEVFLNFVDFALEMLKQLGDFQCNFTENELGYFKLTDEWAECAKSKSTKLQECFILKASESDNAFCRIDFPASGNCVKTTIAECGEEQGRGLDLITDFISKYLEKNLDCSQ